MRILGIDPGSQELGYGILDLTDQDIQYIEHGALSASKGKDFTVRLGEMSQLYLELIERLRPDQLVIEKIFLGRNVDSAFKLGHIRGVCISHALHLNAEIYEYTPREVKKGITGSGQSTKEQVQLLLYNQIEGVKPLASLDASDALALSFYHATHWEVSQRHKNAMKEMDL